MQLTTEVNECVIIQHNGGIEFITEKQALAITEAMTRGSKGIARENGKGYLFFSSIADIMTVDKYYEKFPDKRPEEPRDTFTDIYGSIGNQQIRKPTQKGIELMKKGFLKYHREQGRTEQEAEEKWQELKKAGIDYKLSKNNKYK